MTVRGTTHAAAKPAVYTQGLGLGFRVQGLGLGFSPLNT
jgi:hypothetical protein